MIFLDFHPRDADRHGVSGGTQGCAQGKSSSATFACDAIQDDHFNDPDLPVTFQVARM